MTTTHISVMGDTVDLVAWKVGGRTRDLTEAILEANPGLAGLGPLLPIGTKVVVPDVAEEATAPTTVNLWD